MESLISTIRSLREKSGSLQLEDLIRELDKTQRSITTKIPWYKWSALFILVCIPLISAVVSIFVAENSRSDLVKYLSYSLTILAVANSIFRPASRFTELCDMGIAVRRLKDQFITEVQELGGKVAPPRLKEICDEIEKNLVPIEHRLIALFLPEAQTSVASASVGDVASVPTKPSAPRHATKSAKAH
jgi:hypothetical protein